MARPSRGNSGQLAKNGICDRLTTNGVSEVDGVDEREPLVDEPHPTGAVGRPDDFGATITFLCSDQARFITGTALPVAGGADRSLL